MAKEDNQPTTENRRGYDKWYVAVHLEWESLFDHADDATVAALTRGIIKYAKHGTIPELDGFGATMFTMMRETIDRDLDRGRKLAQDNEKRKQSTNGGRGEKKGDYRGIKRGVEGYPLFIPKQNKQNKQKNNLPTPLNPPFPRSDAEMGDGRVGGSVDSSFSSSENKKTLARKPSSYSELEDYVTEIGYSTFDTEALWYEMEESDWQIPDKKSGNLRPLKSWKNFVKYRAENSTEPDNTPISENPDKPILETPEDKKLYERYVKEGILCSFEGYREYILSKKRRKSRA